MKFYVATRLERAAEHNLVRDTLMKLGHEITYDWTVHGPVWRDGPERIREVAQRELQGVLDADVVVVLLPGGRGTHAELGMALAANKPVLLHGDVHMFGADPETCAFYHHPNVRPTTGALVHVGFLADRVWGANPAPAAEEAIDPPAEDDVDWTPNSDELERRKALGALECPRRCVECAPDLLHHWLDWSPGPDLALQECKHCDALRDCPEDEDEPEPDDWQDPTNESE